MNKLLGFMNMLLAEGADAAKTGPYANVVVPEGMGWLVNILATVYEVINAIIVPILIIVATAGIVYAIVLGVNYAKAETSDQKEEAKKRIINVVVGAVLMIVLMLALFLFIKYAPDIFGWVSGNPTTPTTPTT